MAGEQAGQAGRVRQDASAARDAFTAGGDQIFNLAAAPEKTVPGLLPRDVPGFTGRADELGRVTALAGGGSAVVTAIGGAAGVGKTAVAIHAAHQLLDRFPGGHLYADLRGYTEGAAPAEPGEVLDVFLRRLGVPPEELPTGVEERSGLLRQVLADRPVLMILDNAATEAQVRPLLPGAGSSLVLITSRSTLAGLDLDDRINLDVLPDAEAAALLAELVGQQRAAAEPEAVAQVAQWCGYLPLALRIAGQLLAAHQTWAVSRLAGLLADERHRLDRLAAGDRQVRAAFRVSYRQLADAEARVFRLLGLYTGPDFDSYAAAALAGLNPDAVQPILDRLALAYLISENTQDRFRMHDLLRLFARQTCEAEDDDTARGQAIARLLDHFGGLATFLHASLDPEARSYLIRVSSEVGTQLLPARQALALFEADRRNLLAAVTLAADQEQHSRVWRLSENIQGELRVLRHLDDAIAVNEAGLRAARAAGDPGAEDRALNNLGNSYAELGQLEDAISCYEQDLVICRDAGDRQGEGQTLINLGNAYMELNRYDDAVVCYQDALAISQEFGDRHSEGIALNNLGNAYMGLNRYDDAVTCYQGALPIRRDLGHRRGEAITLISLGAGYMELNRYDDAVTSYRDALAISQEFGDKHHEGMALVNLGSAYAYSEQYDDAITYFRDAIEAFRETGDADRVALTTARLESTLREVHKRGRGRWWRRRSRHVRKRTDSADD